MLWLLLTHVVAFQLFRLHPRIWLQADVKRFTENGSKDSLLRTFHRQRWMWRCLITLAIAFTASLPVWGNWLAFGISFLGLLLLGTAYWVYYFNPALNEARKLPYVGKYHVSWNPLAAYFPDRYVWRRAWLQVRAPGETVPPAQEDLRVVAVAGPMLKTLLGKVWIGGCLTYSLCLIGLGLLYTKG
ncbi:hypothetical protein SAMN06265337_0615 [Hymenobacter gelipurpurascens]|uniref:Uncharacterized protein n=1 Tax=Hymenobacter gelipurpurascens TaxID=89968 RepID=A0A212T836_9BACT|nr:hypothetical protein [Hymenobacter gelipurpurascens]SNC62165.1 hypothetical protein SAMN06265337_0615 [Hymenobacter gelipurpurascens]